MHTSTYRVTAVVPATNEPPTLARCIGAIEAAAEPPEELIVVRQPPLGSPALARNLGARAATGDVLVFVDADVEVHADAFSRIRRAFEADGGLTALFGSYDDAPSAPGVVSGFRNLLHHHVHQSAAGPAATFWAGLGAVLREAFLAAGGFDEERFRTASIEDIELGVRLTQAGGRIRLDPALQGTHLKAWTLRSMLYTDFARRGVPWVMLLLRTRSSRRVLNLGWRHRLSAAVSVLILVSIMRRRPTSAVVWIVLFLALNRPFYAVLLRRRGPLEAGTGLGLHLLHHLAAVAAVPVGVVRHVLEERRPEAPPNDDDPETPESSNR